MEADDFLGACCRKAMTPQKAMDFTETFKDSLALRFRRPARGPRRAPGRKCRKSAPRSALGTRLGVPEKCRKTAENVLEMLKEGRGAFSRQFFGTFSGTPSRVPESTSGSTFSALSARSSSGPLWLVGGISTLAKGMNT